ncbi:hypothetical protein DENSPDRAFT_831155 [Dentipellis sp. KUC8613]|nr:hypothetical protein DENSPDRAFT_831155 [Dentipellis sp. KUC8613]
MVMDTNVLLGKLDVLQQFVEDAKADDTPVRIIIPGIVISELDHQKNRPKLAWAARRASTWLLEKVKERRLVKGQAHEETCKSSGKWNVRDPGEIGGPEANDNLILDCCRYFALSGQVALCSSDKNLCIKTESTAIASFSPTGNWSSREIARALFGDMCDLSRFDNFSSLTSRQYAKAPRKKPAPAPAPAPEVDEDMMDVDDTGDGSGMHFAPSHPLDALHLEVIEHFSRLLMELVGRVGGPEVPREGGSGGLADSKHAPKWARKWLGAWSVEECLAYLSSKRVRQLDKGTPSPKLEVFLLRPYGDERGCRRGQEWSKRDWEIAIGKLEEIAQLWDDKALGESVAVLGPYAKQVFERPYMPL